jgi:hypothetical protein
MIVYKYYMYFFIIIFKLANQITAKQWNILPCLSFTDLIQVKQNFQFEHI